MSDPWTIKEKLYLASAVTRIGENNWGAVSKIMRNMTDNDRLSEFFSQKNCAQEYTSLVDAFTVPRRKRTDSSTTSLTALSEPSFSAAQIVEQLTQQRIAELKRIVQQEQTQYRKLVKDIDMIRSGQLDHQVPLILEQMTISKSAAAISPPKMTPSGNNEPPSPPEAAASVWPVSSSASPLGPSSQSPPKSVLDASKRPPEAVAATAPPPQAAVTASTAVVKVENTSTTSTSHGLLKSPPRTPTASFSQPLEFASPSRPPPVTILKASTPSVSPSMSPSSQMSAVQGALLSPVRSVSHSPPRSIENQALQEMMQKLQQQQTESAAPVITPKQIEVEKLPAPQVIESSAATTTTTTTVEVSDSEDEDEELELKPLATDLKPPQITTETANIASGPVESQDAANNKEREVAATVVAPEQPKQPEVITEKQQQTERERPPKRIVANRGRIAIAGQTRRKQNSGGSTTSSEASSTVRSSVAGSASSRSPLPVPSPFPDYETYKQWKKMILNVWSMAAGHRHASLFLQPVRDSIAPGYSKVVKRPVDLTTIKRNIENGTLTSTDEVRRDLLMMFVNAVMYNASNTEINQMARDMAADVMKHLDDLLVPINAMFSGGGVEATKSLRSNRQRHPKLI